MLQKLCLGPLKDLPSSQLVPPVVQPLLRAAQRGEDVAPIALAMVRSFGFDGFWYGISMSLRPSQETRNFLYSTWPESLTQIYDQRAYVEVDPRIQDIVTSVVPVVWDQSTYRGRSREVDAFLDVLQSYGVGSGVMCSLRDHRGCLAVLSLSSAESLIDEVRQFTLERHMGDILLFQRYFHDLFVAGALNALVPPHLEGAKLSRRERECLSMAARGLTGEDIGLKLGLSIRTVQSHFDSMRSKLAAANRQEAIAKAIRLGIISA